MHLVFQDYIWVNTQVWTQDAFKSDLNPFIQKEEVGDVFETRVSNLPLLSRHRLVMEETQSGPLAVSAASLLLQFLSWHEFFLWV